MTTFVVLGKLGKPHGLNGLVRFWPFNPNSESMAPGTTLRFQVEGEEAAELEVESIRWRQRFALLKLRGINSKEAVAQWTHAECSIGRDDLPEIDEDEFYLIDLIELPVYARQTQDEALREVGHVVSFMETGAHDVMRVRLNIGRDLLVPFVMGHAVDDVILGEGVYLAPLDGWAIKDTEI